MIRPVVAALASVVFAVLPAAPARADSCQVIEVTVPPHTIGAKVCPPPS